MNNLMTVSRTESTSVTTQGFNQRQIEILKNSICKGVSNDEFEIFLMACTKTQLDPFMKQIYAVKRKSKKPDGSWGESMTIQTGIDGYRLIAERTSLYAPGQEPTYTYDQNGNLLSATSYVKKQTKDGSWHIISSSAYLDEYCQTIIDRQTGERKPSGMWATMPRTMLAKCAEAQALRKAFPAEMSGIYTKEEMAQADNDSLNPFSPSVIETITLEQSAELQMILDDCDKNYREWFFNLIKSQFNIVDVAALPIQVYDKLKAGALKRMEAYRDHQRSSIAIEVSQ